MARDSLKQQTVVGKEQCKEPRQPATLHEEPKHFAMTECKPPQPKTSKLQYRGQRFEWKGAPEDGKPLDDTLPTEATFNDTMMSESRERTRESLLGSNLNSLLEIMAQNDCTRVPGDSNRGSEEKQPSLAAQTHELCIEDYVDNLLTEE